MKCMLYTRFFPFLIILLTFTTIPFAAEKPTREFVPPQIDDVFGSIAEKFKEHTVILQPDTIAPEWWAGAPSLVRDSSGVFWMACRMRSPERPRGLRGYEIRLLRSNNGVDFQKVHSIHADSIPLRGFERPSLLLDPHSGQFKLYLCGPWKEGPWSIIKLDDVDHPKEFDPDTARPVIEPLEKSYDRDIIPLEYKDPFILYAEEAYHAYLIGYTRRSERIFHFRSENGETWSPVGNPYEPIMDLEGWHNFFVRPACVIPLGVGYLFFYEGSHLSWYDPVYNLATGVGYTFDLHNIIDLTPDSPLVRSHTPGPHFSTWRYSHWMYVENELWVYAEVATPQETNEIRLYKLE